MSCRRLRRVGIFSANSIARALSRVCTTELITNKIRIVYAFRTVGVGLRIAYDNVRVQYKYLLSKGQLSWIKVGGIAGVVLQRFSSSASSNSVASRAF